MNVMNLWNEAIQNQLKIWIAEFEGSSHKYSKKNE